MSNFRVERFQGKQGLLSIKDEWNTVAGSMPRKRYFHLHEFHLSYISSLEKDQDSVHFYVIRCDQRPIAIVPLALRTVKVFGIPIRIYKLYPDTTHLEGLTDCICSESCSSLFQLLIDHLKTSGTGWDILYIRKCLADSCIIELLNAAHGHKCIREHSGYNGYVSKTEIDNVGHKIATKSQAKSNRNLRKLQRKGEVELTQALNVDDLKKDLKRFIVIEDSGWKGDSGTSIKSDPKYAQFYDNLMENLGGTGACEINLLSLNGQSIAGQVTFVVDDTCYIAKIAYDESYSKMTLGMLMCEQLFRRLSEQENFRECNFISFPKWIDRWNYDTIDTLRVLVFNPTLRGRLSALMLPWAKRLNRVPKSTPTPNQKLWGEGLNDDHAE